MAILRKGLGTRLYTVHVEGLGMRLLCVQPGNEVVLREGLGTIKALYCGSWWCVANIQMRGLKITRLKRSRVPCDSVGHGPGYEAIVCTAWV